MTLPATIAITNPFCWPHVRRGAERMLNDLSVYLVGRGVRVETYTMAPANTVQKRDEITKVTIKEKLRTSCRQLNSCHYYSWALQESLRTSRADIVHCLTHYDAYAAVRVRRRFGLSYKVLYQSVGIPTAAYFRSVPLDRWMFRQVLNGVDAIATLSSYARQSLLTDFGKSSSVLPPPVDISENKASDSKDHDARFPRLLFVGDIDEPRKGARVLCRAFCRLKEIYPDATLTFSGNDSEDTINTLSGLPGVAAVRDSIRFLGVGKVDDLAPLYESATLTILPSVWEAFGLVIVESLAAGTPVVAARHAGIPDIVNDPKLGQLFCPGNFRDQAINEDGLVEAIVTALDNISSPSTHQACQDRARHYSWSAMGPAYLSLYEKLHSGRSGKH